MLIGHQVHRKYLLPETLMAFGLPWDFHPVSPFLVCTLCFDCR